MATPVIAAGATAFGLYLYASQRQSCGEQGVVDPAWNDTHRLTERPPTTWSETLYLFKEALRYVYQETLGRWSALDLFFGLAFLARRDSERYPAADIAATGTPLAPCSRLEAQRLLAELRRVRRYMVYCQGLRHRTAEQQQRHWADALDTGPHHILVHNPTAGLLRPAFAIVVDPVCQEVLLVVRGTNSRADLFTSLTGVVKPHHIVCDQAGAVLGYSHLGMLAAARWLMQQTKDLLLEAQAAHPDYAVRLVGHSMGGGTAALLALMLREKVPQLSQVTCWAIACPACATLSLARGCAPVVTSLLHGTDIVPTFSTGTIDALREQVVRSSWFADFRASVRQQLAGSLTTLRGSRGQLAGLDNSLLQQRQRQGEQQDAVSDWGRTPSIFWRGSTSLSGSRDASWGASSMLQTLASRLSVCYQRQPRRLPLDDPSSACGSSSRGRAGSGLLPKGLGLGLAPRRSSQAGELDSLLRASGAGSSCHGTGEGLAGPAGSRRNSSSSAAADVILEKAVEHALEGVTSGLLPLQGPVGGMGLQPPRPAGPCVRPGTAVMQREPFLQQQQLPVSTHSSSSSRPAVAAAYQDPSAPGFMEAASRVVLGAKRPVAPLKKDDDSASVAPRAASPGAGGPATTATSSSSSSAAHQADGKGVTSATAAKGMPADAAAADGDIEEEEASPAAAAVASGSSISQLPSGLRRRGWAPWDLWNTSGWVRSASGDGSANGTSSSSAGAGVSAGVGRVMVEALGATVNGTGRLMAATTGQLLRGPGLMFNSCRAQGLREEELVWANAWQQRTSSSDGGSSSMSTLGPPQPLGPAAGGSSSNGAGPPAGAVGSWRANGGLAAAEGGPGTPLTPLDARPGSGAAAAAGNQLLVDADEDGDEDEDEEDPDLGGAGALGDPGAELDAAAVNASIGAVIAAVTNSELAAEEGAAEVPSPHQQQQQQGGGAVSGPGALSPAAAGSPGRGAAGASGAAACPSTPPGPRPGTGGPGASSSSSPVGLDAASGSAAASYYSKKLQHKAKRQMYPLGRLLHLMPVGARLQGLAGSPVPRGASPAPPGVGTGGTGGGTSSTAPRPSSSAATGAAGGAWDPAATPQREPVGPSSSSTAGRQQTGGECGQEQQQQQQPAGAACGEGQQYELLEVPNAEVYGRVVLCRTMVRDHFIPSYLRALDSVLAQLEAQAGEGQQ